jgi:hypothetical protein
MGPDQAGTARDLPRPPHRRRAGWKTPRNTPMESSDALMARFLALHARMVAMVEPLPLVPATWITGGSRRSGWPSAASRTSPHLVRFHERIRLGAVGGGRFVPEDRLAEAFAHGGDGRALAVGAGDVDHRRQPPLRVAQRREQALDPSRARRTGGGPDGRPRGTPRWNPPTP